MCRVPGSEARLHVIRLPDIEPHIVRAFLRLLYTGELAARTAVILISFIRVTNLAIVRKIFFQYICLELKLLKIAFWSGLLFFFALYWLRIIFSQIFWIYRLFFVGPDWSKQNAYFDFWNWRVVCPISRADLFALLQLSHLYQIRPALPRAWIAMKCRQVSNLTNFHYMLFIFWMTYVIFAWIESLSRFIDGETLELIEVKWVVGLLESLRRTNGSDRIFFIGIE